MWEVNDEWWGRSGKLKNGFNTGMIWDGDDSQVSWAINCIGEPIIKGVAHTFQDAQQQVEAAMGIVHA